MGGECSLDLAFVRLGKKGRGKRERRKGGADLGYVPGGAARRRRHCWPRAPTTMAARSLDLTSREGDGDGAEEIGWEMIAEEEMADVFKPGGAQPHRRQQARRPRALLRRRLACERCGEENRMV
jgi:hypothetical protein